MKKQKLKNKLPLIIGLAIILTACNKPSGTISVNLEESKTITPIEYGWHYEEIGMIGEGGLHAEMVRNRGFEEANPPKGIEIKDGQYVGIPDPGSNSRKEIYEIDPLVGWAGMENDDVDMQLKRVYINPLNNQNPHSIEITVNKVPGEFTSHYGLMNTGYFGMYLKEGVNYDLSFYARTKDFKGPLRIVIIDSEGNEIAEPVEVSNINSDWKEYAFSFTSEQTVENGNLLFEPASTGKIWLDMVSMFPGDTWDNGNSVFRADIMQNLYDYAPDFLRFPGGCIVHGVNVETMYYWKRTIGDISERPGSWSKWGPNYRTDGLGYHEFYELCEYLNTDAMYVTPTGMVCTGWVFQDGESDHYHHPAVDVDEYIQNALDAIEYAIGPVTTRWGAQRAKNGHPEPFPLKYIEIGNEDFGPTYYEYYDKFYHAIHAKYPELKIIANSIIGNTPDRTDKRKRLPEFKDISTVKIFDEHYYKDLQWVIDNYFKFDEYKRREIDLFIGELGIRGTHPLDVLGESVFMMSMERNADMDPMMADRPLMRNWTFVEGGGNPLYYHTNTISFKSFNYYMSKLFRDNKIGTYYTSDYLLNEEKQPITRESLFSTAGRDPETGELIIKIVNLTDNMRNTALEATGREIYGEAIITVLAAENDQKNTPEKPFNVTPSVETRKISFPDKINIEPRSLTILRIKES